MVAALKSLRGLYRARELSWAVAHQLLDTDATLQQAALKCLKGFKLKYVGPYMERLLRLATDAHLREELTAFPLSPQAEKAIHAEHRPGRSSLLV